MDVIAGTLLFLISFAFYATLGHKLANGQYLDYYNLGFDFDPYLYLSTLVADSADKVGFKHPLIIGIRPIAQLLMVFGIAPKFAAVLTMCLFGAATNVLVWCFLRLNGIDRLVTCLLSVIFALSSTTVITAIVTESYGVTNFAIALTWLMGLSCIKAETRKSAAWRYVSALVLTGTTITNVVQSMIVEFCVGWQASKSREAIRLTVRFWWKFALLFIAVAVAVWHAEILAALHDPVGAARNIWWLQTKGEKSGFLEIIRTFFVYSFIAPDFTTVTLSGEGASKTFTRMLDFREWRFSGPGACAVVLWLVGLALGTLSLLKNKSNKKLYVGIVTALLFNIIFHRHFQFRGSLYLYAAHTHFLIFALFSRTALLTASNAWRRNLYIAALVSLVAAVGLNNVPLFDTFVNGFVHPATNCPAPCQ